MDRNVKVNLTADVDPFQRSMEVATKSIEKTTNAVVVLAKKIDELWKSAGKKLELFGAGGLASLVAATEAASRLDIAFRGVRSTAAVTGQAVRELKEGAEGLARALPASNSQVAQLMGQVQDLGVRGTENIVKFTEVALRLATATNTAPGELFSGLMQLTRTMNGSTQDLERYSSSLVALSKNNGVAAQSVIGFSNAIEAVASRAGYTQAQVLGLSTAFARAGADSGAGATAFIKVTNDISEAMRTGSKQLDTYANLVGMSRQRFQALAQDNPAEAFIKVIEAIKDSGPKGIAILQQLGLDSIRTQRAVAALTSGQANLKQTLEESSEAYRKNEALNKASNAAYADLSSAMTKFRTAIAQVAEAMGGPFLGVATKMVEALTKVINVFNTLPGPVKTTIAVLAAVGSSLTIGAGALMIISLAVVKFGLAWRLMSGAMASNVFKGLFDGLRGAPRALDNTSSAMTRLYNATYKTSNAMRGSRMADTGPGLFGTVMGESGTSNPIGLPGRYLRSQLREVGDTLRHPLDYRKRNPLAYSEYSIAGMGVRTQKWAEGQGRPDEHPFLAKARDLLKGNPEENLSKAQQENLRLRQIADEKARAYKEGYAKIREAMREDPEGFDQQAATHFGKKASGGLTDRHREVYAQNVAQAAANEAAKAKKKTFDQADIDSGLAPFKAMTLKIKTMSGEMVADVGTGTAKIMDLVTAAFAQSVAKIVELAARAKMALLEVSSGSPGVATHGLAGAISGMSGAATNAGEKIRGVVAGMNTPTAGRAGMNLPLPSILGGWGPLAPHDGTGNKIITLSQAGRAEEFAAGSTRRTGALMASLGEKASGLAAGFTDISGKVMGVVGPLALIGTAAFAAGSAIHAFAEKGKQAALKMATTGEEFANALGQKFKLPTYQGGANLEPGDRPNPYSDAEYAKANAPDFIKKHKEDIERFQTLGDHGGGVKGQAAYARILLDRMVASSGGNLNSDAQQEFRQLLMSTMGREQGTALSRQLLANQRPGPQTIESIQELVAAGGRGRGSLLGSGSGDAQQAYAALGKGSLQIDAQGRPVYAAAALLAGEREVQDPRNRIKMQSGGEAGDTGTYYDTDPKVKAQYAAVREALAREFQDKYPGQKVNLKSADSIEEILKAFRDSGGVGGKFADDLEAIFNSINYKGADAATALKRLGVELANVAQAADEDPNSAGYKLRHGYLGQIMQGADIDFNLDADRPAYRLGGMALNTFAGYDKDQHQGAFNDIATYTRQLAHWMEVRASNPGNGQLLDLANANIAAAQGGINQQRTLTMSGTQQIGAISNDIITMANSPDAVENTDSIQAQLENVTGLYNQQLDQLKGFILQVRSLRRQERYEEQDHTKQLGRMWRDRNLQIREMQYQYGENIRQSTMAISQSFGNPGAFVQSSYTQSASSAMTGLRAQNEYLQRSKRAMDTLGGMGVSKDVIREMGLDDPKNFVQAERFVKDLAGNPKLVSAWNTAIKNRLRISEGIATDPNNSKFAEMKRQFDKQGKDAAAAFKRSLHDFDDAYKTAQKRQLDSINQLAADAMDGVGNIMRAAKDTGIRNIRAYANEIVRQSGNVQAAIAAMTRAGVFAANIGGGGPGGATGTYRNPTAVTGGQRGGGYGDVGVTSSIRTGAGGAGHIGDSDMGSVTQGGTTYVMPGTGTVYSGGRSTYSGRATDNFQPSEEFMRAHPANPSFNKSIARSMIGAYRWNTTEFNALDKLWTRESGWKQYADNPGSSAYGIPQALPGTKMGTFGKDWRTNPATQIAWGLSYIANRYGSPSAAWSHEQKVGWYGKGGVMTGRQIIGVAENGPEMVLPLNGAGVSFVAHVVAQTMARSGLTTAAMMSTRTAGHAGATYYGDTTYHVDSSTNFTGAITVEASDPNEMARKLAAQKRLKALTRPPSSR
jgi:TP901 family phage tail tape measure protein